MKSTFNFIFFIFLFEILFGEIKSFENSILRMLSDKIDISNSDMNDIVNGNFLQKAINSTNLTASFDDVQNFIKGSKFLNNTKFNYSIGETDIISNITGKFNCFYFNSDDFSVFDLSHLDKDE